MAGKETPRQKMIGMMYLVLTAMLALNVSEEFMNAFRLVNEGLENTTENFSNTNKITYGAFESAMKNNPVKTKPYYDKALLAQEYSAELNKYVTDLKKNLIEMAGGIDEETHDIAKRSDMEIGTQLMITQKKGQELRAKILETRTKLLDLVDPKERANFNFNLDAKEPVKDKEGVTKTWESKNFEGVPVTAAVTLLSKIQNDIKNAESDVVTHLLKSVDATDFKFDQLSAVVVAPTSYVLVGQSYEADVFLTAYSSTQNPDILVGGNRLPMEDGKGKYRITPSKEGFVKWGGIIKVKSPDGTFKGVPNPISVSAPGIPKEKLKVSMSGGGSITGSNGSYVADVKEAGKVMITVSGEVAKGQYKTLGGMEYRVKRVPDPVAKVGGMISGSMNAGQLKAQRGVFAVLENFDFDLKFTVKSFNMTVVRARMDAVRLVSTSAAITPEMQSALSGIGPKDKVFFDEIVATGPDGSNRRLNGVVINVQ
jgi:hypothetical protein